MKTQLEKSITKSQSVANDETQVKGIANSQFIDNRESTEQQQNLQGIANDSPQSVQLQAISNASAPIQLVGHSKEQTEKELKELKEAKHVTKAKNIKGEDSLEHKLQNPKSTDARPRQGLADRQKKVMKAAALAQPFMEKLDKGEDLLHTNSNPSGTHTMGALSGSSKNYKADHTEARGGTDSNSADPVFKSDGSNVHQIGAKEFTNEPRGKDSEDNDHVERKLPVLDRPSEDAEKADAGKSRKGLWSEADLNPLTFKEKNGDKMKLNQRDEFRLLHTAADSKVKEGANEAPLGKKSADDNEIDSRYFVTTDHYESMVPVSPLQKDYKKENPYTSPYTDPEGKKSSLELHDEKEKKRVADALIAQENAKKEKEEDKGA